MSTISRSWQSITALSSNQPGNDASGDLSVAPAALEPDAFRRWTLEKQAAYIAAKGTGSPKSVTIGPNGGEQIIAALAVTPALSATGEAVGSGSATAVTRNTTGRPATATELATIPDDLSPAVFFSWRREDQDAYIEARGIDTIGESLRIGKDSFEGTFNVTLVQDVAIVGSLLYGSDDPTTIPYLNLPGSAVGTKSPLVMDQAEALFPSLDGVKNTLPFEERPAGFYVPPSSITAASAGAFLEDFTTWHSAYQLEYINAYGTAGVLNIPTSDPLLTAFISISDPKQFYILGSLQKADFAKMSNVDQLAAVALPSFSAVATKLGLASSTDAIFVNPNTNATRTYGGSVTAAEAIVDLQRFIDDMRVTNASSQMPGADKKVFKDELALLLEQVQGTSVISKEDVAKKISDIKARFERAHAFYDVKLTEPVIVDKGDDGAQDDAVKTFKDVISMDDNATINRGYQIFMAQERRIGELSEARMQIVRSDGVLFGQNLDVPTLVYRFQSLYNLSLEAEVVMETEEINQQNALLKTYAAMQDFINETLSKFEKADSGSQRILGLDVNAYQDIDETKRKIMSMFETADGSGQRHPLETLRNISRPTQDMFKQADGNNNYDLNPFSHLQWSAFGTRLSEAVTSINQNSQIKMNDINSLDKERNRHFDLANSALSKASEIINAIARG